DSYKGVGVTNPSFYNLINLAGAHWAAYHINRVTHVCCTFDPMQGSATLMTKALREVVERLLHLDLGLSYEAVTWCKQRDGSSCGVLSLFVLEILLSNQKWVDKLYNLIPNMRLRYNV
ncbi:hypothetical protein JG688_00009422, partial [Phytophthora aleatoria]